MGQRGYGKRRVLYFFCGKENENHQLGSFCTPLLASLCLLFAFLCYFLTTPHMFFNILFIIFVLYFCILFCVLCVFVLFLYCSVYCFSFCTVTFLFLYQSTDHCHRMETQLK